MKSLRTTAIALLVAAALVSCYWSANAGQGRLTLDLSQVQPRAAGDVVRVYLLANGLLFSTGAGVPFSAEVVLGNEDPARVQIDGLPVGPVYQALVGIWQFGGSVHYSESETFQVTAGESASVTLPYPEQITDTIGFSTDLAGKRVVGVTADSNFYAATESAVYEGYFDGSGPYVSRAYSLAEDPYGFGVSSCRINGLSADAAYMGESGQCAVTSQGILPFDYGEGWQFYPTFSSALLSNRNILESGTLFDDAGSNYALFFRRDGGIGGTLVYVEGKPYPDMWSWVDVDLPGVRDMTVSPNFAYFATEGGAFALPPAFLEDFAPALQDHRLSFKPPAEVLSVGFRDSTLFLGTTDGAWYVAVEEDPGAPSLSLSEPLRVPNTEGERIQMIAVSSSYQLEAYLSRYWLYVSNYGLVTRYPFFAVIPGKATGMAWSSAESTLYISGTEGLSALYLGFC